MRDQEAGFTQFGVRFAVVTFESASSAQGYVLEMQLSWPLLIDESRDLYRSYGMFAASFWDVWGPRTWRVYLREVLKGQMPKKTTGDIRQRGGDVLIDPAGIVRLHHVGRGPADRPAVARILDILGA